MRSTKSSNRRTHAQSSYQSQPEQPAGQPAGAGTVASGMPSPSEPSGVLNELSARPTKRRRTQASAVRSAPGWGAHPTPNVTSTPFPSSALPYGDLPPNRHVHHPQLSRADAPEPQGATAQQPASEDAAVHEEPQAQVDCPLTSGDMRKEFAKLRDNVLSGTRWSGSGTPYTADKALIGRFVDGAEKGANNFYTTKDYVYILIRFSAWLKKQKKGGLQDRLLQDLNELRSDALNFQTETGSRRLIAAVKKLHDMASAKDGTVKTRRYRRNEIPDGDKQLINDALSATSEYATVLRAFSGWLHAGKKKALCEPGRLHSEALTDDARAFMKMPGSHHLNAALRQLQIFKCTGSTDLQKKLDTREIPEVDCQLSEDYKAAGWESSCGMTYTDGRTYADMTSGVMRSFSAWLQQNKKDPIACRLHDRTLDEDVELYTSDGSSKYKSSIRGILTQVREMSSSNAQLPDLGGRAEPSGSSYSSRFPSTTSGVLPPAPQRVWNFDTPVEEVTEPASSAQPEASSPPFEFDRGDALYQADVLSRADQREWDLDTFPEQFMASASSAQPEASSYSIPFDWEILCQEATEPQHTTAMPQASTLSFDEKDTGPSWKPGAQQVPDWLLQHAVRDEQMVRIRGIEYRVFTKQVEVDGVNQAKLWLKPEQFLGG
ncbi:hypothetical protein PD5205_03380 [Xanthomonas fragariae]|uniref:Uncharacterized protein n=2 Tax=Xanthomonas fragariae TaxID=48664 RepID=A0A1Y6HNB3_9XANT|nr:hypothetical protein PD5205_03380 [Xanthomonas fragariae]